MAKKRTPTENSYHWMMCRCYRPKTNGYNNYGGRGITVCERWRNSKAAFIEDMGLRPEGCVIDRKDNDLGYFKENCRWITQAASNRNKRMVELPYPNGVNDRERRGHVHRLWVKRNSLHRKKYIAEYWKKNKPVCSLKYRQWRLKNLEKIRERKKVWGAANKDKVKAYNRAAYLSRKVRSLVK